MSIDASNLVWKKSKTTGTPRLVMLAIADNANSDGYAWPGIKTMAEMCNCSERQVTRIVAELEASGELYVERGVGRKNYTRYLIALGLDTDELSRRMVQYLDYSPLEAVTAAADHLERKGDISDKKVTTVSPFEWTKKGDISGEKVTNSAEKVTSVSPDPIDPLEDPVKDNTAREALPPEQPTVSSSSSRPAGTERIKLPAAAVAALTQPHDPAYMAAKVAYENNIGMLTPITSDLIKTALHTYPPEWIPLAIERAVAAEKRQWNYVAGILRNWSNEGFTNGAARTGNAGHASKSKGYGRYMQQASATSAKGPDIDYDNDPEWQEFVAGFVDARDAAQQRLAAAASD